MRGLYNFFTFEREQNRLDVPTILVEGQPRTDWKGVTDLKYILGYSGATLAATVLLHATLAGALSGVQAFAGIGGMVAVFVALTGAYHNPYR